MRVLLAVDGSAGANDAVSLARTMALPAQSTIRIVSVLDPGGWVPPGLGGPGTAGVAEPVVAAYLEEQQEAVLRRFAESGHTVDATILRGRPASAIIEEATSFQPDVVIVGSRGHGPIASLVLGSVSAEIVDHAPCPVLVARRATLSQVVLAADGSPTAKAAEGIVVGWRVFDGLPIRVVSVAEIVRPWTTGVAPGFQRQAQDAYAQDVEDALAESQRIAEESAARVRKQGRVAKTDVRRGDAAAEIVSAIRERRADLVVLGSRGRTGLSRIFLGSVARNVLMGTDASVLIVRDATEMGVPRST